VKITRGAELVRRRRRALGLEGNVGVDATAVGVPVSVDPQGPFAREMVESEGFTESSDFVFAYRLNKIHKHVRTSVVTGKEEVKGAVLSEGLADAAHHPIAKKELGEENDDMEFEIVVNGFDVEDIGLNDTPPAFQRSSLREGDEGVTFEVISLKESN
jgi:hypothetical protein